MHIVARWSECRTVTQEDAGSHCASVVRVSDCHSRGRWCTLWLDGQSVGLSLKRTLGHIVPRWSECRTVTQEDSDSHCGSVVRVSDCHSRGRWCTLWLDGQSVGLSLKRTLVHIVPRWSECRTVTQEDADSHCGSVVRVSDCHSRGRWCTLWLGGQSVGRSLKRALVHIVPRWSECRTVTQEDGGAHCGSMVRVSDCHSRGRWFTLCLGGQSVGLSLKRTLVHIVPRWSECRTVTQEDADSHCASVVRVSDCHSRGRWCTLWLDGQSVGLSLKRTLVHIVPRWSECRTVTQDDSDSHCVSVVRVSDCHSRGRWFTLCLGGQSVGLSLKRTLIHIVARRSECRTVTQEDAGSHCASVVRVSDCHSRGRWFTLCLGGQSVGLSLKRTLVHIVARWSECRTVTQEDAGAHCGSMVRVSDCHSR